MNDCLWSANGYQDGPTPGLKFGFYIPLGGVYKDVKLGIIMLEGILP